MYGPPILSLCRRHGVSPSDLEDVSQQVLLRLRSAMAKFECRRWLKVVLEHGMQDLLEELAKAEPDGDARRIRDVIQSTERARDSGSADAPVRATILATRARQVLAELTPDEEFQFRERWWEAGAAIWHESRPSFRDFFGPLLTRCFQKWGLEAALAEKAALALQERIDPVLDKLEEGSLPRFRSWLNAVVRNAARDCLDQMRKTIRTLGPLPSDVEVLLEDDEDFAKELELREIRLEAERRARSQHGISERHWMFYCYMVHDGWTAPQVAQHFDTTTGSVYMAVKRVKDKVTGEMRRLEDSASSESHVEEP
jgi:DNA-directed RNA polymerase specialized sigma24 family protein